MWLPKVSTLLLFLVLVNCETEKDDELDASSMFMEAARSFLTSKEAIGGLRNMASSFVQSDTGKQVGGMMSGEKSGDQDIGQMLLKVGSMLAGDTSNQGFDLSSLGTIISALSSSGSSGRSARDVDTKDESAFNFERMLSMGSMLLKQNSNVEALLGLLPIILENFNSVGTSDGTNNSHDHSGHSWYLPPILENLHIMWEHFRNSELGQTLWKKSGLSNIITQMSDRDGNIQYERILDSFENPQLRRRWIKTLTNFVAEWISHVSDPTIQQRYLTTIQFVGNSFLKAQGYPKTAMFDSSKPSESITRLANVVARKHLGMKIDSSQYVKPAVAYIQELMSLASERGFIMSRINARELSKKLSDTINDDIIGPMLKSYRAYKWAIKSPQCANQILCTINEKNQNNEETRLRSVLAKITSFPAAWAVSNKIGMSFWSLYGVIMENDGCIAKYPANCTAFHEEEIRVTTESIHNEL